MVALSRSGKIILLLVLNIIMFLAELIVGYLTGSLALVADAFHMLSDVLSQIIALYAIRLAAKTEWQPTLSYGWQRAELLGALYNGVFLLALCFSILLDAVERFFKPEDIENPKLVLIVGGIGLACNLLGLFLFHDHGHGHGHSHGHSHSHSTSPTPAISEKQTPSPTSVPSANAPPSSVVLEMDPSSPLDSGSTQEKRPPTLRYHSSLDRISPLKQTNLQNLQQAAQDVQQHMETERRHEREESAEIQERRQSYHSGLGEAVAPVPDPAEAETDHPQHDNPEHSHDQDHDHDHAHGNHSKPSGQDLNMRGIFLHVLGDALGSVGVIVTALFIWLTDFSWRFYMDPIISLLIVAIIVHSALPLVRSASFILMQGVPVGVEIEEIRREIKAIPDVISIHDLHIWQLTNIKMVASLHVLVTNQAAFERVSRSVKKIMHRAGVHSTTIQPEFPGMHPYLHVAKDTRGLHLRKIRSDEEGHRRLLTETDVGSKATSVGALSEDILSEVGPEQAGVLAGPTTLGPSRTGSTHAELVLAEGQEALGDDSCVLLCVDGEEACEVGSCCTVPVKR